MRNSMKTSLALALSLTVASCAATRPEGGHGPVAASAPTLDRSDFVPIVYSGHVGVWISEDGLASMLIGFEQEKGDLKVQIARSRIGEQLATERASAVEAQAKKMAWAAQYAPWIAFVSGVGVTLAVTLAAVYAGRALAFGGP